MALRILVLLACVAAISGCKSTCDQAADVLEEKCGAAAGSDQSDSGESCEADTEILAGCINDNGDKTCAEIQAACFAP